MADPACPRMTLFRFTDAALGQRFGAGAPVLAGIAGGAAGKTGDFPRALLPGGQELLVGSYSSRSSGTRSCIFSHAPIAL